MSALKEPPMKGTYNFVLRKHPSMRDDPSIPNVVPTYVEVPTSRDITHNDGVRSQTMFVVHEVTAQRLRNLGWQDVTKMWNQGNHPTGSLGAPEPLDLAKKARQLAKRKGGVEEFDETQKEGEGSDEEDSDG